MTWWWLSFASAARPAGDTFMGAAVVDAPTLEAVVARVRRLGIAPAGFTDVAVVEIGPEVGIPEAVQCRLLSRIPEGDRCRLLSRMEIVQLARPGWSGPPPGDHALVGIVLQMLRPQAGAVVLMEMTRAKGMD